MSLAEYDRLIEENAFGRDSRIELIHGEIREMNPIGSKHEAMVDRLCEWSIENRPRTEVVVRVQNSIWLAGLQSAPQPDLAWVVRRDYYDRRATAEDVRLLIEVADSTLDYDKGEKADLYAASGILDYWVVDLSERAIEVRRDPDDGTYRHVRTYAGQEELRPLAYPDIVLRPVELWEGG